MTDHAPTAYARAIRAAMVKNWRVSLSYPSWILNRVLSPIVWVALSVYTYIGIADEETVKGAFTREAGTASFTGFLILGQTLFSFFSGLNWRGGMAIQRERWYGTLELVLLAPTSRVAFVLGESLFGLLDSGWTVFLAAAVAVILFGADFQVADPLALALALALALISMVALGVFFAGFYMLTRAAGPLSFAVLGPVRFLSGTAFPLGVLPALVAAVGYALPVTFGLLAVRRAALSGATVVDLLPIYGGLLLASAVCFVAGAWLIGRMEDRAKRTGSLHVY